MKVLLHDKNRKLYPGRDGGWVRNAARARDFVNGADAVAYVVRHQLVAFEMVYTFADETQNIRVAVEPFQRLEKEGGQSRTSGTR